MASVVRPFTFSRARSSSASVTPSAATRRSSSPITSMASSTLSGRVPTYRPTWPESMNWLANE